MVNSHRWALLVFIALAVMVSCTRSPLAPTATDYPELTPEPETGTGTQSPVGQSNLLYRSEKTVIYTYHPDPADMESAYLCLRRGDAAPVFLAQTGDQVRWFINAVALEEENKVVFAQYQRAQDLAEVWIIGFDGEAASRLLETGDFTALGEGYARAIPRQMLALPDGNILLTTTEFSYPAKPLDDLYLLDTGSGTLTQLLAPGQAGTLTLFTGSGQVLIDRSGQALVLEISTLQINPASSAVLEQASAIPQETQTPFPDSWLADCAP